MKSNFLILATASATLFATTAVAQVSVKEPWIRATVPQQKATGAFMQLSTVQATRLVEASSPVAGAVEIHEMKMDNNIMKMRQVNGIDLPAGKSVDLKPGGYHVMLLDLKEQMKECKTQKALTLPPSENQRGRESFQLNS